MKSLKVILTSTLTLVVTFSLAQVDNSVQNYKLSRYYSYYDVYQTQSYITNNDHCIKEITLSEGSRATVEYVEQPYYDNTGSLQFRKVEVKKPGNYTTYSALKNSCPYEVVVKGTYKCTNEFGEVSYRDCSQRINPNANLTLPSSWYFMNSYNSQTASIGAHILHTDNLSINSDVYNTYLKTVVNSPTGTIPVYSFPNRTRIYLNKGDKVSITAEGSIRLGAFAGSGGPDGIDGFTSYNFTKNARHGSLIYRIGDGPDWYFVGSSATITANTSGVLKLNVNDNNIDDNEGRFIVNYKIIRANSSVSDKDELDILPSSAPSVTKSSVRATALPNSCIDLENIANLNTRELTTYLTNNGFIVDKKEEGFQYYTRQKDDEGLELGIKKDSPNRNTIIALSTKSKERYRNIRRSLAVEEYDYKTTTDMMAVYQKKTKTTQSTFDRYAVLGYKEGAYVILLSITR